MKRFLSTATALILLAGSAGSAAAQGYNNNRDDHRPGNTMMRGPANNHFDNNRNNNRHNNWRKGGRIERSDWNRGKRVDYRSHRLQAPPRGYEWRQVDNNYVLAAVATGLIASILLANR